MEWHMELGFVYMVVSLALKTRMGILRIWCEGIELAVRAKAAYRALLGTRAQRGRQCEAHVTNTRDSGALGACFGLVSGHVRHPL